MRERGFFCLWPKNTCSGVREGTLGGFLGRVLGRAEGGVLVGGGGGVPVERRVGYPSRGCFIPRAGGAYVLILPPNWVGWTT